jgi:hypothetical protein
VIRVIAPAVRGRLELYRLISETHKGWMMTAAGKLALHKARSARRCTKLALCQTVREREAASAYRMGEGLPSCRRRDCWGHPQFGEPAHSRPENRMIIKPKISTKQYESAITAARKAGGDLIQSHLESRLKAVVKRRRVKKLAKPGGTRP